MLSVKAHIATTTIVLFGTLGIGVLMGNYLLSHGWGKFSVMSSVLLLVAGALFLVDRFVPAKCPRCGAGMHGDGSAYRWIKKCRGCGYIYSR
jgi:hypothetical protein